MVLPPAGRVVDHIDAAQSTCSALSTPTWMRLEVVNNPGISAWAALCNRRCPSWACRREGAVLNRLRCSHYICIAVAPEQERRSDQRMVAQAKHPLVLRGGALDGARGWSMSERLECILSNGEPLRDRGVP